MNYRDRYSKDPRIIFLDFSRAADQKKVMTVTALIEVQISNVHVVVMANSAPQFENLKLDPNWGNTIVV
jgi:hypothetical protein